MKIEITIDTNLEQGIAVAVDKPYRWTSADVVRKASAALRYIGKKKVKVGHAGTLDPLATGILIICIGKATKQAEAIQAQTKEYIAEIMLGATTPCCDLEQEVDATFPTEHITREMVESALLEFKGEQLQVPPIFSAKLIDGKRAYEYARKGEPVEMRKALVNIYDIELLSYEMPKITIKVTCSKGTYIRAIARDLGLALGSGGHLTGLVRTKNGEFTMADTITVEELTEMIQLQKPQE